MTRVLVSKLIHNLEEDLILQMFPIEVLLPDKLERLVHLHVLVVLLNIGLGNSNPSDGLILHGPEDVRPGGDVLYDQPDEKLVFGDVTVDGASLREHVDVSWLVQDRQLELRGQVAGCCHLTPPPPVMNILQVQSIFTKPCLYPRWFAPQFRLSLSSSLLFFLSWQGLGLIYK